MIFKDKFQPNNYNHISLKFHYKNAPQTYIQHNKHTCFFLVHTEYSCLHYEPLIFSVINNMVSKCGWKTVWILISWLNQKPADQNPHCFQKSVQ